MFGQSSIQERRRYYREEWSEKDIPDFIADGITKREFGFDHLGHGPNDRYKVFFGTRPLKRFLRQEIVEDGKRQNTYLILMQRICLFAPALAMEYARFA